MSEQVEGQLTLFLADSPASRSPLPGSGGEAEGEETGHLYRYKKYG